jgi:hypothetical protein
MAKKRKQLSVLYNAPGPITEANAMGTLVNMYHLVDGPHRPRVAVATTAAHHRSKCKGSSNPVQLPCHAVEASKPTTPTTGLEVAETFNRGPRPPPPPTRAVTNTFNMMITLEVVEWVAAAEEAKLAAAVTTVPLTSNNKTDHVNKADQVVVDRDLVNRATNKLQNSDSLKTTST